MKLKYSSDSAVQTIGHVFSNLHSYRIWISWQLYKHVETSMHFVCLFVCLYPIYKKEKRPSGHVDFDLMSKKSKKKIKNPCNKKFDEILETDSACIFSNLSVLTCVEVTWLLSLALSRALKVLYIPYAFLSPFTVFSNPIYKRVTLYCTVDINVQSVHMLVVVKAHLYLDIVI